MLAMTINALCLCFARFLKKQLSCLNMIDHIKKESQWILTVVPFIPRIKIHVTRQVVF